MSALYNMHMYIRTKSLPFLGCHLDSPKSFARHLTGFNLEVFERSMFIVGMSHFSLCRGYIRAVFFFFLTQILKSVNLGYSYFNFNRLVEFSIKFYRNSQNTLVFFLKQKKRIIKIFKNLGMDIFANSD
jgi:hypothetical protein